MDRRQVLIVDDEDKQLMPETVHVKSLNRPDELAVLEQNYEYDLMNEQKLLDKDVGKPIIRAVRPTATPS